MLNMLEPTCSPSGASLGFTPLAFDEKESGSVSIMPINQLFGLYPIGLGCPRIRGLLVGSLLSPRRKKVLCIDDDPMELLVRSALLEANGYDTLSARSGSIGLKMMQESKFDAVLLDFCMPGMDGLAVAAEARRLDISYPILIVSGQEIEDLPPLIHELTNGFLRKGTPPSVFLARLGQITGNIPVI